MDFLLELLFGLLFELPMEAALESKRLKNWVKTASISVSCAAVLLLIAWAVQVSWLREGWSGMTVGLCALLSVGTGFCVWMIRDGHRRKWVQERI